MCGLAVSEWRQTATCVSDKPKRLRTSSAISTKSRSVISSSGDKLSTMCTMAFLTRGLSAETASNSRPISNGVVLAIELKSNLDAPGFEVRDMYPDTAPALFLSFTSAYMPTLLQATLPILRGTLRRAQSESEAQLPRTESPQHLFELVQSDCQGLQFGRPHPVQELT